MDVGDLSGVVKLVLFSWFAGPKLVPNEHHLNATVYPNIVDMTQTLI